VLKSGAKTKNWFMNKKTFFLILSGVLASPLLISAQGTLYRPSSPIDLPTAMQYIESTVWTVFVALVIICFVVAGILFLTAGGEPEKIKTAKTTVIWAIAGVVVAILAYSIKDLITGILSGGGS
jgi:hypothetical protein